MIKVELTRFKVKKGTEHIVDEWLRFLNDNMKDVLLTLENEKMYVESIHREEMNGVEYLYWYSIQDDEGIDVQESDSYIDKKHLEYWDKCIDYSELPKNISTEVIMLGKDVNKTIKLHNLD